MRGFWIVFDGIDGSGKGTIASEIMSWALKIGVPLEKIVLTAEPTNSIFGKKIRSLLSSSKNVDANLLLDLYLSDRKSHLSEVILPALQTGKLVICDRFKYSTFVYQQIQGISFDKLFDLHRGMPLPDVVFVLDLPVDVAIGRIKHRNKKDFFETKSFLEKARLEFLGLSDLLPNEKIFVVDSSKPLADLKKEVIRLLKEKTDFFEVFATAGD